MKVGIIGLGRMGEGMSRRMIKAGIEVPGVIGGTMQKAEEAYEAGLCQWSYHFSGKPCSSSKTWN